MWSYLSISLSPLGYWETRRGSGWSRPVGATASLRCRIQLFAPRLTGVTSRLSTQTSLSWIAHDEKRIRHLHQPVVRCQQLFTAHFVARLQQTQLLALENRVFWDRGGMERENLGQNKDTEFRKSLVFYYCYFFAANLACQMKCFWIVFNYIFSRLCWKNSPLHL